ncbi:MAG: Omp28-related outer membrane protein [Saprospiraceae bacterium]|nr:Omp28-related outer membrane protein [Saprospiraceae bacterium]
MKKFLIPLIALGFFLGSCNEIPVVINPVMDGDPPPDTIVVDGQDRQVLIEEFTGVRCVQCPAGSAEIQDLLAIYGNRLIAISLHAGEFSPPHPDSEFDFRTNEGDNIINYVGNPLGYPSAVIDRKLFPGEFDLQLGKSLWAGYIASETANPPKVRIGIAPEYNEGSGNLNVDVVIFVDEEVTDADIRLSVAITEDNIVDRQTTPEGEDYEYVHKHVFRGMMTNWDGDALEGSLFQNQKIEKSFSMAIPSDWKPEDCHVIAYVHLAGTDKEVLQAAQVEMVE